MSNRDNSRIFILKEKYGSRYVHASNRETTARNIVKQRIYEGYYDQETIDQINSMMLLSISHEPVARWLLNQFGEYEEIEESYLENFQLI